MNGRGGSRADGLCDCAASAGMTRIRFDGCVLSRRTDIYQVSTPDNGLTVAEMSQNNNPKPDKTVWGMP